MRKAAHRALSNVRHAIETLRFNTAVAQLYEFANLLQSDVAQGRGDQAHDWAQREALEILFSIISPMTPHIAEEAWAVLGHETMLALSAWPVLEQDLLIETTVVLPVQVNGKKRSELQIAKDASKEEMEAAILADEQVQKFLDGQQPRKIIIVPGRIINVVL